MQAMAKEEGEGKEHRISSRHYESGLALEGIKKSEYNEEWAGGDNGKP